MKKNSLFCAHSSICLGGEVGWCWVKWCTTTQLRATGVGTRKNGVRNWIYRYKRRAKVLLFRPGCYKLAQLLDDAVPDGFLIHNSGIIPFRRRFVALSSAFKGFSCLSFSIKSLFKWLNGMRILLVSLCQIKHTFILLMLFASSYCSYREKKRYKTGIIKDQPDHLTSREQGLHWMHVWVWSNFS